MSKIDVYEQEVLTAFERGVLKSVATNAALAKFKAAARATVVKDRQALKKTKLRTDLYA